MSWPQVPLGEVAEINPKGPTKGELAPDELVDFVPMASVSESGTMMSDGQRRYSDVSKGYTAFKDRDILLAKITPCFENNKIARASIATPYAFGSTEFHVIRTHAAKLDEIYLNHFLRQDHIRDAGERRMTGSGGQRRVPKTFLEELKIPLPPLEEQKRIAGILDQADALRRLRTRALDKLNTLGQAIFHEMFGDLISNERGFPVTRISDVIDGFDTGKSLAEDPDAKRLDGFRILKISSVTSGRFNPKESKPLPESYAPPKDHIVHEGDLLGSRPINRLEAVRSA